MKIRRFKEQDAENCSGLIIRNFKTILKNDYPKGAIKAMIGHNSPDNVVKRSNEKLTLVAERKNKIVGIVALKNYEIGSLFVEPDEQGKGVGLKLMGKVGGIAMKRGIKTITLESTPTARGFYEKMGYKTTKKYHRCFRKSKIMVFLMSKSLE